MNNLILHYKISLFLIYISIMTITAELLATLLKSAYTEQFEKNYWCSPFKCIVSLNGQTIKKSCTIWRDLWPGCATCANCALDNIKFHSRIYFRGKKSLRWIMFEQITNKIYEKIYEQDATPAFWNGFLSFAITDIIWCWCWWYGANTMISGNFFRYRIMKGYVA